jgi:hypothetical protein
MRLMSKSAIAFLAVCAQQIWAIYPDAAMAQTLGGGQSVEIGWWRVALALLFCLCLAVSAAAILKRRGHGSFGVRHSVAPHIKIVEVTRLNHRSELNLILCDGTYFLIAVSPQGTNLIGQVALADHSQAPNHA